MSALTSYLVNPQPKPEIEIKTLDEFRKISIDILVEKNKFMLSVSLIMIGGILTFLLQFSDRIEIKRHKELFLIFLSLLFPLQAIYCGYVINTRIVEMLSNNFFNPHNNLIYYPQIMQFYFLLFSILIICGLIFAKINYKGRN